jgi:hypothetical protein
LHNEYLTQVKNDKDIIKKQWEERDKREEEKRRKERERIKRENDEKINQRQNTWEDDKKIKHAEFIASAEQNYIDWEMKENPFTLLRN